MIGSDGTIYIGSYRTGKLYAVNPDGTTKWTTQLSGKLAFSASLGHDGTIYVGTSYGLDGASNVTSGDNKLYALNTDGSIRWTFQAGGRISSKPAIDGNGTIYFAVENARLLYAVDSSGQLKWTMSISGLRGGSPAIIDGKVIVSDQSALYIFGSSGVAGNNNSSIAQYNFLRNLSFGSSGSDVKQLQALLVNEVNYPANLVTGYFGRITHDAVKKFQEKYGIKPAMGYFGEITRKALNALISN